MVVASGNGSRCVADKMAFKNLIPLCQSNDVLVDYIVHQNAVSNGSEVWSIARPRRRLCGGACGVSRDCGRLG